MADCEGQIRHQLLIHSNHPCHISSSTFWDVQTSTLNRFDPSTERFSKNFLGFLTQNGPKVNEANKQTNKYYSGAIKHVKFNEDLKKLFESHPKDFAIRKKLAEIFIVQCDCTGKMEA